MARPWTADLYEPVLELVNALSDVIGDDRRAAVLEVIGIDVNEDIDGSTLLRRASEQADHLNPVELMVFGVAQMRHSLALDREPAPADVDDAYGAETCYDPPPPPEAAWFYSWGGRRYRTCNHIPSHTTPA